MGVKRSSHDGTVRHGTGIDSTYDWWNVKVKYAGSNMGMTVWCWNVVGATSKSRIRHGTARHIS